MGYDISQNECSRRATRPHFKMHFTTARPCLQSIWEVQALEWNILRYWYVFQSDFMDGLAYLIIHWDWEKLGACWHFCDIHATYNFGFMGKSRGWIKAQPVDWAMKIGGRPYWPHCVDLYIMLAEKWLRNARKHTHLDSRILHLRHESSSWWSSSPMSVAMMQARCDELETFPTLLHSPGRQRKFADVLDGPHRCEGIEGMDGDVGKLSQHSIEGCRKSGSTELQILWFPRKLSSWGVSEHFGPPNFMVGFPIWSAILVPKGWPSDQASPEISRSKDSLLNRSSWQLCWSWAMPDHFPGWWFVRILVLVSACDSACFAVQLKVFKGPLLWWLYGAQYDVKYGWWSSISAGKSALGG